MHNKTILLCAGGTGGHIFPSLALAAMLQARGWAVHLATDERGVRFADQFQNDSLHVIPSATFSVKNPVKILSAVCQIWRGYRASVQLIRSIKPDIVVGFGGYPTIPPLVAALRLNIPTLIHEQNAVMGRANTFLARWVSAIAGGFLPETGMKYCDKTIVTGNPVRLEVLESAQIGYEASTKDTFNLLIFGGSQGARYFSEVMPEAIALLPEDLKKRIHIIQQARENEMMAVRASYEKLGVKAEIAPFFHDMPVRIAHAHFVISRSGASTVSELSTIGRPSLLVPYPLALDHDQAANAQALCKAGGAFVKTQESLTPQLIADYIIDIANNPQKASDMAQRAQSVAPRNATERLVELVETVSSHHSVASLKKERAT